MRRLVPILLAGALLLALPASVHAAKGGKRVGSYAQITGTSSVTASTATIPYGGTVSFTWTVDQYYAQVAILVTCTPNATTIDPGFTGPQVANAMQFVYDDYGFGGYDVPSVSFTLPDSLYATVWFGGGADCLAELQTPTYTYPPTGSSRTWNDLATAPFTVTP